MSEMKKYSKGMTTAAAHRRGVNVWSLPVERETWSQLVLVLLHSSVRMDHLVQHVQAVAEKDPLAKNRRSVSKGMKRDACKTHE